ncbi:MAG: hypothetical protein QXQ28_04700 [Candidatus Nezhaarchaeales archaeon]
MLYGFLWSLIPRRPSSMADVLKLFYYGFLRLDELDVEVVKLSEDELVTRCRNPCPILWLALRFNLDTKKVCREVSEPVCRYVLERISKTLTFERNYNRIRPYSEGCEERIYLRRR